MKIFRTQKNRIIIFIYAISILVFFAFFSYDIYKFFQVVVENHSIHSGFLYLKEIDQKGMVLFASVQFLQILFGMFPSEFVQVGSMIVFAPWIGFLIGYAGSFLGSLIVYFIVKFSKMRYFEKRHQKMIEILEVKTIASKSLAKRVFKMYTHPFIPIGAISYYYAHKRVGFFKYCLVTALSLIPSLLTSFIVAYIVRISYKINIVFMIIVLVVLLLFIIFKNYLDKLYGSFMRSIVLKPNTLLFRISRFLLTRFFNKKNNVFYHLKEMDDLKPPFIVICNHPSNLDFIYASHALKPYTFNTVVAKKYFYERKLRNILTALGCIPIDLFSSDITAAKSMKRVIQNRGIVLILPEGRVSTLGRKERITQPIGKLLKNLQVDVVLLKIEGAYYTTGKFFKNARYGQISVGANHLFTSSSLEKLSVEEINHTIESNMFYDDSGYIKRNQDLFFETTDVSLGLDNILFICPNCKRHYTLNTEKNSIKCTECSYNATVNKRYEIFSLEDDSINIDNLPKFYDFQYEEMKKIVLKKSFYFQEKVSIKMPSKKTKYLTDLGEGVCSIDRQHFILTGKFLDGTEKVIIPIKKLPTLIFGNKNEFHLYYEKKFYYIKSLENNKSGIKWSFISEVLYDWMEEEKLNLTKEE